MQAGVLRHRVTISTLTETSDGKGSYGEAETPVAIREPAEVMPLSGRELERARQIDPRLSLRVVLRHRRGVAVRQQVVYHDPRGGDRVLEIGSVMDPDERGVLLELLCKERV